MFTNIVGICLFSAFNSIYIQFKGLYGYNGLYPIDKYIDLILNHYIPIINNKIDIYYIIPSISIFYKEIGVSTYGICEFLIILGTITSSLIIIYGKKLSSIYFIICFICYLSIVSLGQVFMSFQWDSLLLEVIFLCIFAHSFISNNNNNRINPIYSWNIRFLAFKLMMMSGLVKLQANCPGWNKLSALEYHFASQPLPTHIAHTFHNFPPILLRFGVAVTLLIEIPLTFLMLLPFPFQQMRKIGGYIQIILQFLIAITGNYAFFNILTTSLMIVVISNDFPENKKNIFNIKYFNILQIMITIIYIYLSYNYMIKFTNIPDLEWWYGTRLTINVNYNDIEKYILPSCIFAIGITIFNIIGNTLIKIYSDIIDNHYSVFYKIYLLTVDIISSLTSVFLVIMSSRPLIKSFGNIDSSFIYKNKYIKQLMDYSNIIEQKTQNFHIFNGYGLFRRMTGVGKWKDSYGSVKDISITSRSEVILEGLDRDNLEWKEIHFLYKPGMLEKTPTLNQPHQPRLDWQMWFLALGSYHENPWIIHLIYKLLQFNYNESVSKDIYNLLDKNHYPFHKKTPKAIRALLYEYDFTRYNTTWNMVVPDVNFINNTNKNWWYRKNLVEFIPALDLENESLKKFLLHNNFPIDRKELSHQQIYEQCLQYNTNSTNIVRVQLQSLICSSLRFPVQVNVFGYEYNAFVFYSVILTIVLIIIRYVKQLSAQKKCINLKKKYQSIKVKLT